MSREPPKITLAELDALLDELVAADEATLAARDLAQIRRRRRRNAILRMRRLIGCLEPGAALPGTRRLAADWGLQRETVRAARDQLAAAGLIERRGARLYVAAEAPALPAPTGTGPSRR